MGYEFWGPRVPARKGDLQSPSISKNRHAKGQVSSSLPLELFEDDDAPDPFTSRVLRTWARGQRRQIEADVELDTWAGIADRLQGD